MKPALVLGLALAAKAMTADNELGISQQVLQLPVDHAAFDEVADDELRSFYGLPRDENGNTIRPPFATFDEVADDELAVALPPRSAFKSDEEYRKMVAGMRYHFDDAADDELALKIVNLPGAHVAEQATYDDEELYVTHKNKRPMSEIAADDELAVTGPQRASDPEVKFRRRVGEFFREMRDREKRTGADRTTHFSAGEADDELAVKIVNLPGAENGNVAYDDELVAVSLPRSYFKSEEEWKRYCYSMRNSRDDAADDELAVKIVNLPGAENGNVAYDDEFLVIPGPPRYQFGTRVVHRPVASDRTAYAFDDDELALIFRAPRVYIDKNVTRPTKNHTRTHEAHRVLAKDDEADDEFYPRTAHWNRSLLAKDDEADSELPFISRAPRVFIDRNVTRPAKNHTKTHEAHRILNKDDEADDELTLKIVNLPAAHVAFDDDELAFLPRPPRVFIDRNVTRPAKNHTRTHEAHKVLAKDDEADDELAFFSRIPRVWFPRNATKSGKNHTKIARSDEKVLAQDDEGDDELLYLGQLLQDRASVAHTLDDDEFRVKGEIPHHLKIQEMGDPTINRKLRPAV